MSGTKSATMTRILSAVIALPVYVFGLYTDVLYSLPVLVVSAVVSVVCLYEYYQIAGRGEGSDPFVALGIAGGIAVNVVMYLYAFGGFNVKPFDARVMFAMIALLLTALLVAQTFKRPIKGGIYSLAVTVFGIAYIVFSFSHVILIKALNCGFCYILLLNVVVMMNDTGAYFGGVYFGRHKTNFAVSPNKSWEGYFTGLLFSVLSFIITNHLILLFAGVMLFSMIEAVLLGIALSVLGHVGDLVESAIKRDGSIKDSGSIIPGHGGMWDVFDALIFTTPLFYYYLMLRSLV